MARVNESGRNKRAGSQRPTSSAPATGLRRLNRAQEIGTPERATHHRGFRVSKADTNVQRRATATERANRLTRALEAADTETDVKPALSRADVAFRELPHPTPLDKDHLSRRIMRFLIKLEELNSGTLHEDYENEMVAARRDWISFVNKLTSNFVRMDNTIRDLPPGQCIYPFPHGSPGTEKEILAASWSKNLRHKLHPSVYAGYHLRLEPDGKSYIAAGVWMPPFDALRTLQRQVGFGTEKLTETLLRDDMRNIVLGGIPNDPEAALDALFEWNRPTSFPTIPEYYEPGQPGERFFVLNNWTIGKRLDADFLTTPGASYRLTELMKSMVPFVDFLNFLIERRQLSSQNFNRPVLDTDPPDPQPVEDNEWDSDD